MTLLQNHLPSGKRRGVSSGRHKKQHFFATAKVKMNHSADFFRRNRLSLVETINTMSFTTKVVLSIISMVIAVSALVSLTRSQLTVNEKERVLADLDRQIAQQTLDNKELDERLHGDLDQYIEAYAREKLDMVKPGERVYINTNGD